MVSKRQIACLRVAGCLSLLWVIAGCIPTSPVVIHAEPPQRRDAMGNSLRASRPSNCSVAIASIIDRRSDPATLGTVAGRPVHAPKDVMGWLTREFEALNSYGVNIVDDKQSGASPEINIELMSAWVSQLRMAKTANIVVRVGFDAGNGQGAESKLYRGTANGINWDSGDEEIQAMINNAFGQILNSMSVDLKTRCKSQRQADSDTAGHS